jgi:hypothetical protein
MKTRIALPNIAEVVSALGGLEGIVKLTGAKRTTAWNWIWYFEAFPPRTYVLMTNKLKRLGYTADPGLWKMQGFEKRKRAA